MKTADDVALQNAHVQAFGVGSTDGSVEWTKQTKIVTFLLFYFIALKNRLPSTIYYGKTSINRDKIRSKSA